MIITLIAVGQPGLGAYLTACESDIGLNEREAAVAGKKMPCLASWLCTLELAKL
jgi:hypothetical protein